MDRICCGVSHKTSALGCRLSRLREGVESASLSFLSRGMCARRKVLDVEEQVLQRKKAQRFETKLQKWRDTKTAKRKNQIEATPPS